MNEVKVENVKGIVEDWLRNHGYDGLFSPYECGCILGDLMPCCSEGCILCEPGYTGPCDCCDCHDFHIGPKSEVSTQSEKAEYSIVPIDGWQ